MPKLNSTDFSAAASITVLPKVGLIAVILPSFHSSIFMVRRPLPLSVARIEPIGIIADRSLPSFERWMTSTFSRGMGNSAKLVLNFICPSLMPMRLPVMLSSLLNITKSSLSSPVDTLFCPGKLPFHSRTRIWLTRIGLVERDEKSMPFPLPAKSWFTSFHLVVNFPFTYNAMMRFFLSTFSEMLALFFRLVRLILIFDPIRCEPRLSE